MGIAATPEIRKHEHHFPVFFFIYSSIYFSILFFLNLFLHPSLYLSLSISQFSSQSYLFLNLLFNLIYFSIYFSIFRNVSEGTLWCLWSQMELQCKADWRTLPLHSKKWLRYLGPWILTSSIDFVILFFLTIFLSYSVNMSSSYFILFPSILFTYFYFLLFYSILFNSILLS